VQNCPQQASGRSIAEGSREYSLRLNRLRQPAPTFAQAYASAPPIPLKPGCTSARGASRIRRSSK
jgi:hypothetical protein